MGEQTSTSPIESPPVDPLIDARLMCAIADGDRQAMSTLYDRYAPRLFGLLLRMLGNRAEAEETLADLFFEVWDRASRYDPGRGCVATYLTTLTRSRAIDRRRRRSARPDTDPTRTRPVDVTDADNAAKASPSPLSDVLFDEQTAVVRRAMERLEEPQRRAIELSFFDGLSHSEIADQLQRPLGTVKTWIRQGLGRLRDGLLSYSDLQETGQRP